MATPVLYDDKTGIYRSDYDFKLPPKRSYFQHVLGDVSWDDNHPVFIEYTKKNRSLTRSQLKLQAQRLGAGLLKNAKLKQGDVVMMISGNCIEFPIVLFACAFAGLKIALANPAYQPHELKHVIHLTQPKKVFTMTPLLKNLIAAQVPWNHVITMDTEIGMGGALFTKKLMVSEQEAKQAKAYNPADYNETQILPFSSGTTGLPKSVEVTHRNLVAMIFSIMTVPQSVKDVKRHLAVLPFYHAYALLISVSVPILVGSTVFILPPPFNPVRFCEVVEKEKIECLAVVPPIFIVLTNTPQANKKSFASVKFIISGAAPLDLDTQHRLAEKTGCEIRSGWGMTETTVGGLGMHKDMKPGTCGRPLPGVEAKCADPETGKAVKKGERGELCIRAANVVKGYYKNEKATKDTITEDGWLKTGDVAIVDEEGNFSIVDRIKELIKVKGFQVPPAELEGLLLTHPQVATAAVIGVYDKSQATEWPRAYIELKGGRKNPKEEEKVAADIVAFIKKKTSPQKQLRGGVRIIDKVPSSPSGKLLRKELRLLVQKEEQEASAPSAHL